MLKPLNDRVVVSRIAPETQSTGGIIVPDTHKKKQQKGMVLAVGRGRILKDGSVAAMEIKTGDTILFEMFTGSDVEINGEKLLVLKEEEILGIIEA